MCDARLSLDNESLALRVEELEKAVKMLQLGVPAPASTVSKEEVKTQKTVLKAEQKVEKPVEAQKSESKSLDLYGNWGTVLKKIAELKKSLSVGFAGASVYTDGSNNYVIRMSGFFLNKLKSSETDLAIVRGVIAEQEGKTPAQISLALEDKDTKSASTDSDIESLFR
jgi:hypothetical protein